MGRARLRAATALALVGLVACSDARPVARVEPARPVAVGSLRVPILMYHHVGPAPKKWRPLYVSLPQFSRQMAAIARSGATTLSMDQLYHAARTGRSFPGGAVALTFDDGTVDQYELVYPILLRHRLRATFFVAPGLFGRPGYLTWAQAREMAASRLVFFEAHTTTHADLTRLPPDRAREEIVGSKRLLARHVGVISRHFAYPYGHYDAGVIALVREAGFMTAVTTRYEWSHDVASALTWGRLTVHDTNTPANLAALARASGSFRA